MSAEATSLALADVGVGELARFQAEGQPGDRLVLRADLIRALVEAGLCEVCPISQALLLTPKGRAAVGASVRELKRTTDGDRSVRAGRLTVVRPELQG